MLPLQEPQTAPAGTQVSYENGKKLSRGGNVGKKKQDSIESMFYSELQENSGEADDVSQQDNEEAQPEVKETKPKREHLLPRCDVPDRKMLPEFATQHWKQFAGITDACDLRYEGNDLSTLRVASSYAVPRINDKPFTLDPQLIQMADNGTRYQDLSSVKRSMKAYAAVLKHARDNYDESTADEINLFEVYATDGMKKAQCCTAFSKICTTCRENRYHINGLCITCDPLMFNIKIKSDKCELCNGSVIPLYMVGRNCDMCHVTKLRIVELSKLAKMSCQNVQPAISAGQ